MKNIRSLMEIDTLKFVYLYISNPSYYMGKFNRQGKSIHNPKENL
jgi:hypothetical protein